MKLTGNLKKVDNIDTKEGKKKAIKKAGMLLNNGELEKVSGGNMMWGRTCKICRGVINNDPDTPDDLRRHCNEDSTQSWVPRPR